MEGLPKLKPRVIFEFEVEKIIGVSTDGNYQVQWAPTWVSRYQLDGCEHLIQEFLQQQSIEIKVDPGFSDVDTAKEGSGITDNRCAEQRVLVRPESNNQNLRQPVACNGAATQVEVLHPCKVMRHLPDNDTGRTAIGRDETSSPKLRTQALACHSQDNRERNSLMFPNADVVDNNEAVCEDTMESSRDGYFVLEDEEASDAEISLTNRTGCSEPHNQQYSITQQDRQQVNTTLAKNSKLPLLPYRPYPKRHHRFKCTYCRKRFWQNNDLTRHLRTHTGERPYSCDHCDYSSKQRGALRNHMRTHTGEKPFVCSVCGKGYKTSQGLHHHSKRCCSATT